MLNHRKKMRYVPDSTVKFLSEMVKRRALVLAHPLDPAPCPLIMVVDCGQKKKPRQEGRGQVMIGPEIKAPKLLNRCDPYRDKEMTV
jgi:hypothetical protein